MEERVRVYHLCCCREDLREPLGALLAPASLVVVTHVGLLRLNVNTLETRDRLCFRGISFTP